MKAYRDAFGNPLPKKDITMAIHIIIGSNNATIGNLQRNMGIGLVKATRLRDLLIDAGVITADSYVILRDRDQALNAALRQLKKGK